MKQLVLLAVVCSLAACGGNRSTGSRANLVTGPVASACNASDRRASNPALCSCIQRVANQSLSSSEQSRVAGFFKDPQRAQDARQSDRSSDERFWKRYKEYLGRAERTCS